MKMLFSLILWLPIHILDRYNPYYIVYAPYYIITTVLRYQALQMAALCHCQCIFVHHYLTISLSQTLCAPTQLYSHQKNVADVTTATNWFLDLFQITTKLAATMAPTQHPSVIRLYCFKGRAGQYNYKSRLFLDWSVFQLQAILCLILRYDTSHTRPQKEFSNRFINHFKKLFNT